jgi:hypothetical protein
MEPRKVVGRERGDPLRRLEELNRFVRRIAPASAMSSASAPNPSLPPRKIVGRTLSHQNGPIHPRS